MSSPPVIWYYNIWSGLIPYKTRSRENSSVKMKLLGKVISRKNCDIKLENCSRIMLWYHSFKGNLFLVLVCGLTSAFSIQISGLREALLNRKHLIFLNCCYNNWRKWILFENLNILERVSWYCNHRDLIHLDYIFFYIKLCR